MLVILKIPILIAAFAIWRVTDNEKYAAAAWGLGAFAIAFSFLGFSGPLFLYGVGAFLVAWFMFFALSFLHGSFWIYPASLLAGIILLGSSIFVGF